MVLRSQLVSEKSLKNLRCNSELRDDNDFVVQRGRGVPTLASVNSHRSMSPASDLGQKERLNQDTKSEERGETETTPSLTRSNSVYDQNRNQGKVLDGIFESEKVDRNALWYPRIWTQGSLQQTFIRQISSINVGKFLWKVKVYSSFFTLPFYHRCFE